MSTYHYPKMHGPVPPQSTRLDTRAVVTEAYTFIPAGCQTDIVSSRLPHWDSTLAWVIAKPMAGFASTFSQYLVEVAAGGGSKNPETYAGVEHVLFITAAVLDITIQLKQVVMCLYRPMQCGRFAITDPILLIFIGFASVMMLWMA